MRRADEGERLEEALHDHHLGWRADSRDQGGPEHDRLQGADGAQGAGAPPSYRATITARAGTGPTSRPRSATFTIVLG